MKIFANDNFTGRREAGFTLVEMMVSMTIFTVLITVGIGAVLQATSQYYIASNVRSIMDNLNFVMEDLSRNLRTGSQVRCVTPSADVPYPGYIVSGTAATTSDIIPLSCATPSNKLIFKSGDGTNLTYVITPPAATTNPNKIIKIVGDSGTPQIITPEEVVIDFQRSGFTVRGAGTAADGIQPTVTIRLAGTVSYKNISSQFAIENTVALRALDE